MQPQDSAGGAPSSPGIGAAAAGGSAKTGLGTILAVVALVIALIAVGINFAIPGPKGDTGATGSTGAQGPQGIPGQVNYPLWAVVYANGTLARGSGVNASDTYIITTGGYQVQFNQSVTACAYIAVIGLTGSVGAAPASSVTVVGRNGDPDGLWIATYNATGAAADSSFHVVVECSGGLWAVVNSNGSLARGSGVTSAYLEATGQYGVVFNQNITNCSYIATLGLTGSVDTAPAGFITTVGLYGAPDGVFVATYNATGSSTNESFHLGVFC